MLDSLNITSSVTPSTRRCLRLKCERLRNRRCQAYRSAWIKLNSAAIWKQPPVQRDVQGDGTRRRTGPRRGAVPVSYRPLLMGVNVRDNAGGRVNLSHMCHCGEAFPRATKPLNQTRIELHSWSIVERMYSKNQPRLND